jgi:hypothetical protein
MLAIDTELSALDYNNLNHSIKETFTAIDRFEWQAADDLRLLRDNHCYRDAGYTCFQAYCENELTKYGGYRRVRDLLSAKKVIDTLPQDLKAHITKSSQTRSLLRLVKTPEKLEQAVAIASQEKPFPTATDFAKAVNKVAPKVFNSVKEDTTEPPKTKTQLCKARGVEYSMPQTLRQTVKVSSQSHSRYGDEGVIEADAPNNYQQIVTFSDGEKLLVNNADLTNLNDTILLESSDACGNPCGERREPPLRLSAASFSPERKYPKEYAEAIAAIEERHKR